MKQGRDDWIKGGGERNEEMMVGITEEKKEGIYERRSYSIEALKMKE